LASATFDAELVFSASISGDSRFLALAFSSYDPPTVGIALLNAKTCKLIRTVLTERIGCSIFVPSKALLITSDSEGQSEICRLIDPKSGKELGRFIVGNNRIFKFALSPDERFLAAGTARGAMVWDLKLILSTLGLD